MIKSIFLSSLFLFSLTEIQAQNYSLLINHGSIELPENKGKLSPGCTELKKQSFHDIIHLYVQFYKIPGDKEKKAFESNGIHFLSYIPNNTYICGLSKSKINILADSLIRAASWISPANKINPVLTNAELPAWALKPNNQIDLMVSYYDDLKHEDVKAALLKNKYYIINENAAMHHFQVRVKTDAIRKIASLPFLSYLDPERAPASPENEVERTDHRSYAIDNNLTGSNGIHYDGAGVNVAVGDDGIIGPHIDYTGRVDQSFVSTNNGDHGDHVCGILAGAGNLNPKAKGTAPACSLFIYQPYLNINNLPVHYGLYKIRITSLSYGQNCNEGYTSDANKIDAMMLAYPAAISVFSAGNSGTLNCNYKGTAIAGWGNITGGMKAGKNVIAVANVWNNDSLDPSSSRGPASDGRIKPDISAVGTNVYATVSTNTYINNTGTSMACPAVSGVLAQLYQAYRANNNAQDPTGAIMKGILLNTADDIGNPGPDYKYGYGRVNALKALHVIENKSYQEGTIGNNDSLRIKIIVPLNVKQVKIMLYYDDKEATSGASRALVNDLNMIVFDKLGVSYQPWVLNPAPNAASLSMPATRKTDSLNNMEQVTIDNPDPGLLFVLVNGFQVPFGPQKFYVIYDFTYDSLKLSYPLGNDHWTPGVSETIRWDSWNTTDPITLQTSTDNISWTTISASIAGKNRLNSYTPPLITDGKLWVKIKQGSNESVTKQFINVTPIPSNLKIDWICSGSCRISWSAVTNASSYNVYRLGAKYMDSVGNTSNTWFVFTGIDSTRDDWFSVKSLMNNNVAGERANAIQKTRQIKLNCNSAITAIFLNSRNNVCTNDTISFSAITNPLTGLNYYWLFPGGNPSFSTLAQPVVSYNVPGNYDVSLSLSDMNGGFMLTRNQLITITGTAANAGIDQTICQGDTATISAIGGNSFLWSLNKALIATTAIVKVAPAQTSTYILSSVSATGCIAYDSVMIIVNTLPAKPLLSMNAFKISTTINAASYQWFKDGMLIPGADLNEYTPSSSGLYKLRIGNQGGCYSYSDAQFFIPLGINKNIAINKISLFPNPNSGKFNLQGLDEKAEVHIFDLLGNDISADFIREKPNSVISSFSANALSRGLYFVCIKMEDGNKILKFVLE